MVFESEFSMQFPRKLCHMKFLKIFFGGLTVISPTLNRQLATVWTILKFFLIAISFFSEKAATSGKRLNDYQKSYKSITLNSYIQDTEH